MYENQELDKKKDAGMKAFALSMSLKFLGFYHHEVQKNRNQGVSQFEDFAENVEKNKEMLGDEGQLGGYQKLFSIIIKDIRKGNTDNAIYAAREMQGYFADIAGLNFPGSAILWR
ncbi:MAG: hypothetical protein JSV92_03845 [archaeon]|nr:MAG: hypothetical protein JSV92_03845 [archaeon]